MKQDEMKIPWMVETLDLWKYYEIKRLGDSWEALGDEKCSTVKINPNRRGLGIRSSSGDQVAKRNAQIMAPRV